MPTIVNGLNSGSMNMISTVGSGQLNKYEIDGNGAYVVDVNGALVLKS
jgi:hypothetical protein